MKTERQKMLNGELYDPMDQELVAGRTRAGDLCQPLNATREAEAEMEAVGRRRPLGALFGAGGETVWMQPPFFCASDTNIDLGERVFFNFTFAVLEIRQERIGSFTLFGPAVQIHIATHPLNAEQRRREESAEPVHIGSDVWVGGGAIILPGVRIGSRAVIGVPLRQGYGGRALRSFSEGGRTGSVVTRDVPEGVFAAGNPCRVVRDITE